MSCTNFKVKIVKMIMFSYSFKLQLSLPWHLDNIAENSFLNTSESYCSAVITQVQSPKKSFKFFSDFIVTFTHAMIKISLVVFSLLKLISSLVISRRVSEVFSFYNLLIKSVMDYIIKNNNSKLVKNIWKKIIKT